jgi:hypothetical protein
MLEIAAQAAASRNLGLRYLKDAASAHGLSAVTHRGLIAPSGLKRILSFRTFLADLSAHSGRRVMVTMPILAADAHAA